MLFMVKVHKTNEKEGTLGSKNPYLIHKELAIFPHHSDRIFAHDT